MVRKTLQNKKSPMNTEWISIDIKNLLLAKFDVDIKFLDFKNSYFEMHNKIIFIFKMTRCLRFALR
jgi:hypothetical protein